MYCFSSTFPQDLFWWCRGTVAQNTFTLFPLMWNTNIYKQFFVKLKWARIVSFSCNVFFKIILLRIEGQKRQLRHFLINSISKIYNYFLIFDISLQIHSLLCNCTHHFVSASLISESNLGQMRTCSPTMINGSPLTSAEECTCMVFASVSEHSHKF